MKRLCIKLPVLILAVIGAVHVSFPLSGQKSDSLSIEIQWMPLTSDRPYLEDVLAAADSFNVRGFQLSHQLIHTVDEIMYPEKNRRMITYDVDLSLLNDFISDCRERNYNVNVWTHEIVFPPESTVKNGKVIVDHPELRKYIIDKYGQAIKIAPNINAFILTLFETEYKVHRDHTATMMSKEDNAANRSMELIKIMHEAADTHGFKLVVRGFEGSDKVFPRLDSDVILMQKNTETDWNPYSPFNDFITENAGKKELWVEFDMGYEYELRGAVPYGDPVELLTRIRKAYRNGVRVFPVRLDRYGGNQSVSAIYTPWGQLGLSVFSRFAEDTSVTATQLINEWENAHFKGAFELLQLSTEAAKTCLFPKMMWYGNHSRPPHFDYARRHILPDDGFGTAQKWAANKNVTPLQAEQFLINSRRSNAPDYEWYNSILNDLQTIPLKLKRIDEIIKSNEDYIKEHPIWEEAVHRLKVWASIYALHQEIYFGIRLRQHGDNHIDRDNLMEKLKEYKRIGKEAKAEMENQKGSQAGALFYNYDKTVNDFREKLNE